MCNICSNDTLIRNHPTIGHICEDCIHWSYCYGCLNHEKVCGFRYNYYATLYCLTCINILYETDDEYNEFLKEVNIIN